MVYVVYLNLRNRGSVHSDYILHVESCWHDYVARYLSIKIFFVLEAIHIKVRQLIRIIGSNIVPLLWVLQLCGLAPMDDSVPTYSSNNPYNDVSNMGVDRFTGITLCEYAIMDRYAHVCMYTYKYNTKGIIAICQRNISAPLANLYNSDTKYCLPSNIGCYKFVS